MIENNSNAYDELPGTLEQSINVSLMDYDTQDRLVHENRHKIMDSTHKSD